MFLKKKKASANKNPSFFVKKKSPLIFNEPSNNLKKKKNPNKTKIETQSHSRPTNSHLTSPLQT